MTPDDTGGGPTAGLEPWALVRLRRDGTVAAWSPAAAALFGIPAEQAIGRPCAELVTTAARGTITDAFDAVLEGRPATTTIVPIQRTDGSSVMTAWTAVPTRDAAGAISGVLATGILLPDVVAGEPESAVALFWRGVFDANPIAVAVLDADDRVLGVNARFSQLFGYAEGEAAGRSIHDVLDTGLSHQALDAARELAVGARLAFNADRRSKYGERVPVHIEAAAFETEGGRRGVVVAYRQLRSQRAFEAQLVRAQRLEGVALLASGVLHDINNLLMVVLGVSDALAAAPAGAPLDDELREDVRALRAAATRAVALARTVGGFARPRETQPDLLDVGQLVERLRPVLAGVVGRGVAIQLDLDPAAGPVHAVPAELEQVVVNLAANARDAMPNGGTLRLRTRHADVGASEAAERGVRPGAYVVLDVEDTGTGMTPDVARRALEPFFTTKGAKGTGLGLATAERIVRRLGGRVAIDTAPGAGTTVRVLLPAAEDGPARSD